MKVKTNILSLLLTLSILCGCSVEDSIMDTPKASPEQEQAQVVLSISVPEVSLPLNSARAITDDKAINKLAIWAFDENKKFIYQLTLDDKDTEGNHKVVKHGTTIYALLPKSKTEVTLALVVNYQSITEPAKGTLINEAKKELRFNYSEDLQDIPMYGESSSFIVKEGSKPDNIKLKRALAKIELDANNAWPNFDLKSVTIVNINTAGTIAKADAITNTERRMDIKTEIKNDNASSHNKWECYIPEATDIKEGTRISLILEGINEKDGDRRTRFYRLDFIKREQSGGEITYDYITSIERNKRYAFKIEHIIVGTGSLSFDEAVNKDRSDNAIINTKLMTIDDENIRDITTDNEYYLGITSPELTAIMSLEGSQQYYTVNMSVVTNNPNGWQIDDLQPGVEVTVSSFEPKEPGKPDETATSVWIYIEKDKYRGENPMTLYVYSGNIRKSVRITIEE